MYVFRIPNGSYF